MKLYNIISEGFKVQVSIPVTEAGIEEYQDYVSKVEGKEITYTAVDNPEDIIRVQPSLDAKRLSEFIVTRPTKLFEGAKVYFGFSTTKSAGEDIHDTSAIEPVEYQSLLTPLLTLARDFAGQTLDVKGLNQLARQFGNRILCQEQLGLELTDQEREDAVSMTRGAQAALSKVYDIYVQNARERKLVKITQKENFTVPEAISFLRRNVFRHYARASSYEVAKQLKHPKNEAQRKITDTFLDLCIAQLRKLPIVRSATAGTPGSGVLDYIVYPQSSSTFNKNLVIRASNILGSMHLEITKNNLQTDEELVVDKEAIYHRAENYEANTHYDTRLMKWYFTRKNRPRQLFDTKEKFVEAWAENMIKTLESALGFAGNIKNVDPGMRPYIKNLFPFRDEYSVLGGKSVLIIDDNIVSSGTVQLIYNMLKSMEIPPRQVDVFIPLKIETNV